MTSFRRRIQYSALTLIVILLVMFDVVVFWAFHTVLYTYVDARLQAVAEAWVDIIERNEGFLSALAQPDQAAVGTAVPNKGEQIELREAALSIRILSLSGTVLWKGAAAVASPPVDPELLNEVGAGQAVFDTIHIDGLPVRRVWVPIRQETMEPYILEAETPLRLTEKALNGLGALLGGASVAVLVLAWFGSNWLARQALVPVEALSATAQKISAPSSLTTRLVLDAPYEEFQRLADAFNRMMERLQRVFEGQRRFVADAAHEIQTPLTALKGNIEVAFRKNRRAAEYREILVSNLSAVERLINLCRSLITLAKLSGYEIAPPTQPIALEPLLRELVDDLSILAEDRDVHMELVAHPAPLVRANKEQLQRVFINLLDNALRHTPSGGSVLVRLSSTAEGALVTVRDTGDGIAPEHLPHIFDRFYRADSARSRESGGVGLGLAIVKEIVAAHDGEIAVWSEVGKGTTFTIRFPGILSEAGLDAPGRKEHLSAGGLLDQPSVPAAPR